MFTNVLIGVDANDTHVSQNPEDENQLLTMTSVRKENATVVMVLLWMSAPFTWMEVIWIVFISHKVAIKDNFKIIWSSCHLRINV